MVICPRQCLKLDKDTGSPVLRGECNGCGLCVKSCYNFSDAENEIRNYLFENEATEDNNFGPYQNIFMSRALDKKAQLYCQDGGLVSTLLSYGLMSGTIDSAILAGKGKASPLFRGPELATNISEILQNAGTGYTYSPNLTALTSRENLQCKSTALVGTPCHINALRTLQARGLGKKYTKKVPLAIGLFCSKCFTKELYYSKIKKELGVNLEDIVKIDIKGKLLLHLISGETVSISLGEANKFTRKQCLNCKDFSAKFADISAGGLGANGWTVTIVRTENGKRIIDGAIKKGLLKVEPIEKFPLSLKLLNRISLKKSSKA